MNQNNFVYQNQAFSFNMNLFNQITDFFINNNAILMNNDNINLITEFENSPTFLNQHITEFIQFCQQQHINLTDFNAIPLNYLSRKYKIEQLLQMTEMYITTNYNNLINDFFQQNSQSKCIEKYEDLFSKHFPEYSNDDRLLTLPISSLYRILNKYKLYMSNDNANQMNEIEIIDFSVRCLHKFPKDATVLLTIFDFTDSGGDYFIQKLIENSHLVDFNCISPTLMEKMYKTNKIKEINFYQELQQMKHEFQEMKQNIENQVNQEIQQIKENHTNKIKELTDELEEQKNFYVEEIQQIKENHTNKIKELTDELEEHKNFNVGEIQQLKSTIYEIDFYNNDCSLEVFNGLKGESQTLIFLRIISNNKNEIIQKIGSLLFYLSKEQQKANYKFNQISYIQIFSKNMKESLLNIDKIESIMIKTEALNMLFENQSFQISELINHINNFNDFYVQLRYPSNNYTKIFDSFAFALKEKQTKVKIHISISELNRKFYNNEYINSIELQQNIQIKTTNLEKGYFESCSLLETVVIKNSLTAIDCKAFKLCQNLKNVVIPQSVTAIHEYAFAECSSLEQIYIPSTIAFIDQFAFQNCKKLKQIEIPSSIISIKQSTFKGCSSLTQVSFPSSLELIKESSFEDCCSLSQITIPKSIILIGKNAFKGCTLLSKVLIPFSSLKSIGNSSFEGCKSLSQIAIPSSVESIGLSAFKGCSSLTEISIPSSITSVESSTFFGCSSISKVTLPSSLKSINRSSFESCVSLSKITIPSEVESIGENCFKGCAKLTEITMDTYKPKIGPNSFENCPSLEKLNIISSVKTIQSEQESIIRKMKIITITSTINSIEPRAFSNCTELQQISLPQSIAKIPNYMFQNCTNLKIIDIPTSVTSIGEYSFEKCISLSQITIPSSVALIGSSAFKGCSFLSQVNIQHPSSLKSIKKSLFEECTSLTQIVIPSSVESIGENCFKGCVNLAEVTMDPYKTRIQPNSFNNCSSLEKLNISSVESIQSTANDFIQMMKIITIQSTTTSIVQRAFSNCSNLQQISLPQSITKIPKYILKNCQNLKSVDIPTSVTSIDEYSFVKCTSLSQITIPSSVKLIGLSAFKGCSSLEQIEIPSSVISIGDYCFQNCSSLQKVIISSSTWIGSGVFDGCSSLIEKPSSTPSSPKRVSRYIDFSNISLKYITLKYPIYEQIFDLFQIKRKGKQFKTKIIWFDGFFSHKYYTNIIPSSHMNRIPGMDAVCKKINVFSNLNRMKVIFKNFDFIPLTFTIPIEKNKFENEYSYRKKQRMIWIYKPNIIFSCDNLVIFLELQDIGQKILNEESKPAVIQQFITPFLLNGFKFCLKLFLLITDLSPLTLFICQEGMAYFCSEPYQNPEPQNLENKYLHLTSYKINTLNPNPSNPEIIQRASVVLKKLKKRNKKIWQSIKDLSAKTIIAIYKDILSAARTACETNDAQFNEKGIDYTHRFSHFLAIDILIDENLNPFIVDLNDNPGMRCMSGVDGQKKEEVAQGQVLLICNAITKKNDAVENWEQILPTNDEIINQMIDSESRESINHIFPKQ